MSSREDTCANCAKPITGELIGVLATGALYDWRHVRPWGIPCDRAAGRRSPEAIPQAETEAVCTVHRKVTRYHRCEDGGTVTLQPAQQEGTRA